MRNLILAAAIAALPAAAFAQAAAPAPAAPAAAVAIPAATGYSVVDTDIGTLIDDPAAKAVLDKNFPGFTANEQVAMARSMTLKTLQQYAPDTFTDAKLAAAQTDLNKLPAKK